MNFFPPSSRQEAAKKERQCQRSEVEAGKMDILSELRRVGQHLAGMAFMLALYCGLVGAGTAGAALGLAGVAALLAITAVGKSQSGIGLDGGEAEENDDLGLDEFQLENPR